MDQHTASAPKPAQITPGLLARKGEARPSLARGCGSAAYGLAYPLIARGLAEAVSARIAHHAPPQAMPHIARAGRPMLLVADAESARKAAFTLRLDASRHARLRAACAASQRSAQLLVTEALDAFLADPRRLGAPLSVGG